MRFEMLEMRFETKSIFKFLSDIPKNLISHIYYLTSNNKHLK
jgi:hypothetical protein